MAPFFRLKTRTHPWGDYFNMLAHGMARRVDAHLALRRTGPFIPPLSRPFPDFVVTADLRRELLDSMLRGFDFRPAIKAHIVRSDWHTWDREATQPRHYPEEGEPENYVDAGEHCPASAAQMADVYELCVQRDAHVHRVKQGANSIVTLIESSWRGQDLFMAEEVLWVFATDRARVWLEPRVADFVCFEPAATV